MEKKYIIPAVIIIELSEEKSLLDMSYTEGEEDIKKIDINTDPIKGGDGQLTKGQGVWDSEW